MRLTASVRQSTTDLLVKASRIGFALPVVVAMAGTALVLSWLALKWADEATGMRASVVKMRAQSRAAESAAAERRRGTQLASTSRDADLAAMAEAAKRNGLTWVRVSTEDSAGGVGVSVAVKGPYKAVRQAIAEMAERTGSLRLNEVRLEREDREQREISALLSWAAAQQVSSKEAP